MLAAVSTCLALGVLFSVCRYGKPSFFRQGNTIIEANAVDSGKSNESSSDNPRTNLYYKRNTIVSSSKMNEENERSDKSKSVNTVNTGWKCACEGGCLFLPPNLMRTLGGPSAALRLGAGGCYHKQM